MPEADDRARASEMDVHLEWPSAGNGDWESSLEQATRARGFFLGQLPDDQPDDVWADDLPDSESFGPHATFETERHDAVDIPAESEAPSASEVDEPTRVTTVPVLLSGGRATRRAARTQRAKGRRSRIAVVVAVVTALLTCTGVYVGTQAKAGDEGARRPTSTSFERQSSSTTGTAVGTSDAAPATEPAPASDPTAGSAATGPTTGAPRGTSPTQAGAGGMGGGPAATSPHAPASTGAPPSSNAPPSSPPPRSPTCQLLPLVCP